MRYQVARMTCVSVVLFLCGVAAGFTPQAEIATSIKDVRILSPEWVCVVVDPTAEILAVRQDRYGADLAADQAKYEFSAREGWYWAFAKTYRTLNIEQSYHQPLFARMNEAGFWTVNGKVPADITVWSHAVDGFPGMDADAIPACDASSYCRTADMIYLKLSRALKTGETVEVKGADGRTGSAVFNDEATPCWSIKVNQSAYASTATRKAAFLGLWLPGIGALDYASFEGKPFCLKKYQKGARWDQGSAMGDPVFTGEIKVRRKFADQDVKREGGANLTGEDVYELDFSAFQGEGTYCIQIPGLGRSWPFEVTRGGYGAAFYTMMKGLFIQRCGMALTKPYTAWERPACHEQTIKGEFIPETENWYGTGYRNSSTNFGFRNEAGKRISVATFSLVGNTPSNAPVMPGVKGGWHDAADFDRRIHHYWVIMDLLAATEAFPAHFKDGQLNIPESGNGIPDILDEVAYGVDVWKSTQRPDGAVSSWIEMESHPGPFVNSLSKAFVENQMAMVAATPDRASALAYAGAAAWLGRLIAPYAPKRSKDYLESARRAYAWARDEGNTLRGRQFFMARPMRNADLKGQTIRFDEDPAIAPGDRSYASGAFAAAYLYLATRQESYLKDWTDSGFGRKYGSLNWAINPAQCVPLILNPGLPAADTDSMKKSIMTGADQLLGVQEAHPYRMLWLAPTDGWFHTMAWGNIYNKSRVVVAAYAVSRDAKYRTSMEAAADFFLGCNPLGQTMMTGIGSVYPVVIQHIHSLSDGIADPVPGIAPYTFTFGVPMRPFVVADGGHASVKKFFTNVAVAFIPDKLGRKEIQAGLDSYPKTGDWTFKASAPVKNAVWKNFPVLRRKVTHPGSVVDQNEFTVNETISPLALLFGALTAENWMPSDDLKNRQPRRTVGELPFYSMP